MRMKETMKKVFSILMCLCLLLQLVPVHVHAEADDTNVPVDAEVKVTINGEDRYMSLTDAITKAISGTTEEDHAVVKLLNDVNTDGYALENSSFFKLDLNGKTINSSGHFFNLQTENVNLTITDNSPNRDGSIIVTGNEKLYYQLQ